MIIMNKVKPAISTLLLTAATLMFPLAAVAASYITDNLEVMMRSGPGLDYRIVTTLKAGQPLEVLGESDGWVEVKTASKQGWVVGRFVSQKEPLKPQLAAARAAKEKAEAEKKTLEARLADTRKELRTASSELSKAKKKRNSLQKELDKWKSVNAGAVEMQADNERMSAEAVKIGEEVGELRIENRQLKARKNTYWFICGAVVLLLGWVLGHIYSTSKGKPKGGFRF